MRHNQKITFRGLADEKPNMETGDIVFVVQEKVRMDKRGWKMHCCGENDLARRSARCPTPLLRSPHSPRSSPSQEHSTFKRKGADLLITKTISLNEAICGFKWLITHLDGRQILIESKPGEIIKPEGPGGTPYVKTVDNEGMPSHGNPFVKGKLFVLFRVDFPTDGELDAEVISSLKKLLPNPCMDIDVDEDEVEHVSLETANVKQFGKGGAAGHGGSAYDDDSDDDGRGGQGVQCQQS